MPLISLIDHSAAPNSWHRVRMPGGYELWHFDAQDTAGGTRLVADFSQGSLFDPEYLHRNQAYRADPTHHLPALPEEYPCVNVTLFQMNRPTLNWSSRYSKFHFEAMPARQSIEIGPNHFTMTPESVTLDLDLEPAQAARSGLNAHLIFTNRLRQSPAINPIFRSDPTHAKHWWVSANPLCGVRGEIGLRNPANHLPEKISFEGIGYQDQLFGGCVLGAIPRRWMRGRMLLADRSISFQMIDSPGSDPAYDAHLFFADESEIRSIATPLATVVGQLRTMWGLAYPKRLNFDCDLVLRRPTIIDSSPISVTLKYEAFLSGNPGICFCDVIYLHRMDWIGIRGNLQKNIRRAD